MSRCSPGCQTEKIIDRLYTCKYLHDAIRTHGMNLKYLLNITKYYLVNNY